MLVVAPLFKLVKAVVIGGGVTCFSSTLKRSTLAKVTMKIMYKVPSAGVSVIVFTIMFTLLLGGVKDEDAMSASAVVSIFSSYSITVNLTVLSGNKGFDGCSDLLIKSILDVAGGRVKCLIVVFVIAVLF